MKYNVNHFPRKTIIATVVASTFAFSASASVVESDTKLNPSSLTTPAGVVKGAASQLQQRQLTRYIVQLEDAPLALYDGGIAKFSATRPASKQDKLNLNSANAQGYSAYLANRQEQTVSALKSAFPGAEVNRQLNVVMNGFLVTMQGDVDAKTQLAALPGVKTVFEEEIYHVNMDTSNDLINTPEVWEQLGGRETAGAGVKVAIIDGGIRPEHPMFQANGHERPDGLPNDDYCALVDPSFCNDKLVVARHYQPIQGSATFVLNPDEYVNPMDYGGHGTHVAGTAVGNLVETNYSGVDLEFSGVAPGATLMVYKALYNNELTGSGSGSSLALVEALEDAVSDGADVINNSWGGGPGGDPAASPYTSIFAAAEAAGVVIATAAGNDGPGAVTIGCPGCAESGLTVASTQHGRTFGNEVEAAGVTGIDAIPGNGDFEITEAITAPLMYAGALTEDGNAEACTALEEGSVEGHIVLTSRGTCSFGEKAAAVAAGGAVGMILHNNAEGVIAMSMPDATLPSVSILQADGEAIIEAFDAAVDAGEEVTATISAPLQLNNPDNVDIMSDFSSRGPNGDSTFLKPDIAAPGSDILSAYAPRGGTYNVIGGTSMASPHVAGAAALLLQGRPELTATEIKSILMSSSNPDVLRKEDGSTPADAFDQGAGRLDIAAAAGNVVSFDKPSLVSASCVGECTFERTVTNLTADPIDLTGYFEFDNSNVTGSVNVTAVTVPGIDEDDNYGSATFEVTIDTRAASEGWQFGRLVWETATGETVHKPIAVYANGTDNALVASTEIVSGTGAIGEPISMRSRAGNNGASSPSGLNTAAVAVRIPEGATVDPDSVVVADSFATAGNFSVAENGRAITWSGQFPNDTAPTTNITPGAFPGAGISLAAENLGGPAGCVGIGGCDEQSLSIGNLPDINYGGRIYNSVSISANGLIALGTQNMAGTFANQNLPDVATPNNVIAPFWSDLQLFAADDSDIWSARLTVDSEDWLAIEWVDARLWNEPAGEQYTFAVWINLTTSEIFFNYIDLGATPGTLTVGFEDVAGEIGFSIFNDGTGTAPLTGDSWEVIYEASENGFITFEYDVIPEVFGSVSATSAETGFEEEVTFDLTDSVETSFRSFSEVLVDTEAGISRAVLPVDFNSAADVELEITVEPENGTLTQAMSTPEEGSEDEPAPVPYTYVYTPNDGFSGEDSFGYKLVDADGNETNEAFATLTVGEDPTPPAPPEEEVAEDDGDEWYELNFGALLALFAAPVVWLRRRRVVTKA